MHIQDLILNSSQAIAYLLLFLVVFSESGLFFGFIFPGDSLLFGLGIAASQGHLSITLLIICALAAAISGVNVGYIFGKRIGPNLFNRPDSLFFKKKNLQKAHDFYQKYGKNTIILARFTPVVRTFAPIVAGIAEMEYKPFLIYNVIGGLAWVLSMTLLGYFLGNTVPNIDRYVLPIAGVIIVASFMPTVYHLIKYRQADGQ